MSDAMDKQMIFMLHLLEQMQEEGRCQTAYSLSAAAKRSAVQWEKEGYEIEDEAFKTIIKAMIERGDVIITATGQRFGRN